MAYIVLVICCVIIIFCLIAIIKNMNTFNCYEKIGKAIYKYKTRCIEECAWDDLHSVEYKDMEDYMTTFWRLWDWGYTRILPIDKFKIIEPYIE